MNTTPTSEKEGPAWDKADLAGDVHATDDKDRRVQEMFSAIASSYDLNNRLHSMWQDQVWRRKAVKLCGLKAADRVLDVACGTGDLSLGFEKQLVRLNGDRGLTAGQVMGVDFTEPMLRIAEQKGAAESCVRWAVGDAMRLPITDSTADVISIAFGIRNVSDPGLAIREFYRVLRPGGRLCILEFSLPKNPVLRGLYNFYFKRIMPRTATWISGDRSGAYRYLPKSVNTFLGRQEMVDLLQNAGFQGVRLQPMTFGIAVVYLGRKA
jgi:demethylmenaquinone methyltransferase/2-methoxy-6-polyprenyl-1,4-benzoquinol methylase